MGTRGAITFVHDGIEKTTYNHLDSYPSALGVDVLEWLRIAAQDLPSLRNQVANLRMVDEHATPSAEELERYGQLDLFCPGSASMDWYRLLRHNQGDPSAILGSGVTTDAARFPLDSLFCEWAYVVDLDAEVFEVYRGFQNSGPVKGRWSIHKPSDDYWPVSLVASWPLSEITAERYEARLRSLEVEELAEP